MSFCSSKGQRSKSLDVTKLEKITRIYYLLTDGKSPAGRPAHARLAAPAPTANDFSIVGVMSLLGNSDRRPHMYVDRYSIPTSTSLFFR